MIVVDTNIVVYHWLPGDKTVVARQVRARDHEWRVPKFWKSEFRNVLCGYLRRKHLPLAAVQEVRAAAEGSLFDREHDASGALVLDIAAATGLSAYDAEFVALAETLNVPLVTEDRQVLKAYRGALSMEDFLELGEKGPDSVHSPLTRYLVEPMVRSAPAKKRPRSRTRQPRA